MTPITLSLFLLVLASFGHCATAKDSCMTHLLTLTGVSESNALAYSRNLALYGVTLGEFLRADDLTLRGLGITSQDDRNRISDCRPPNSTNTLHSAVGTGRCPLGELCSGHGECKFRRHPGHNSGHYACKCQTGYSGDQCSAITNNCLSDPCMPGGICENAFNNFTCHCSAGYTGQRCQEKWLTKSNARSRLHQLSSDIKNSIKSYKYNLAVLIENQTNRLRTLLSSVAELEQQRLPRYRAFTDKVTWQEAARRCATFGGGLAMVKNLEEQQEVYDIASHYQLSRFWLGANDQTIDRRWSWWDGTGFDYRNFSDREANNFARNEDCLEVLASYRNGLVIVWNGYQCYRPLPFLCQFW